ncbi:lipid II flippase Amj family protein [Paenibacillus sp. MWE-103]|uniref:Lipid II flippase Amj n=1 Tax=Paenibacillus artemisiicola TaxID=1172618 RepID=A0ABS3WL76_9BACL|nr:lipid II flippase Amj family protein [Paenibacillus artemisiicola]MBO7749052.1 lipid II flippase Amj family protein [Paenibacillus artemisiicola]
MIERIILISSLTLIIHAAETLSYAVRMAGIRTGKLAIALSLTGMIVLVSRTSNIAQGTMTGKIVDLAKKHSGIHLIDYFRIILMAASIGTLLAIALFPSFVALSSRMVSHLEQAGSIPRMAKKLFRSNLLLNFFYYLRMPKWEMARRLRDNGMPKRFMLMNCCVTAIYTVGVLAALYASYLPGNFSTGASQASGLINGLATIMLTLLIDPHVALLTDKVLRKEAKLASINRVFGALMFSRFCGTLLAQIILLPAAYWIKSIVPYL